MSKISGITIERTARGIPRYVRIDLTKHKDLIPILREKGIIDEPEVKFTPKIKRSIREAKNGEYKEGSIDNFWQ